MKKYIVTVFILFFGIISQSQTNIAMNKKVLIIVDLTMTKLKNIQYLVENKYIDIPNLKITAIYNTNDKYDFSQCENYIKTNKLDFIEMKQLRLNIDYDSLFCKNSLTPVFYKLFKESDGVLFMGGDDIPPLIYHEKTIFQTEILAYEKMYMFSFMYHLIGGFQDIKFKPFLDERPDYVVMGICLGMQNMNVSSGGNLFQDIPSEIYHLNFYEEAANQPVENQHRNYWNNISNKDEYIFCTYHPVEILPQSFFKNKMKISSSQKQLVLSAHHQCIKNPGMNLFVSATSADGKVIEAIEHSVYANVFGIQFHPEYKFIYDNSNKLKMYGNDNQQSTDKIFSPDDQLFNKEIWRYFSRLLENN